MRKLQLANVEKSFEHYHNPSTGLLPGLAVFPSDYLISTFLYIAEVILLHQQIPSTGLLPGWAAFLIN